MLVEVHWSRGLSIGWGWRSWISCCSELIEEAGRHRISVAWRAEWSRKTESEWLSWWSLTWQTGSSGNLKQTEKTRNRTGWQKTSVNKLELTSWPRHKCHKGDWTTWWRVGWRAWHIYCRRLIPGFRSGAPNEWVATAPNSHANAKGVAARTWHAQINLMFGNQKKITKFHWDKTRIWKMKQAMWSNKTQQDDRRTPPIVRRH